MSQRHSAVPDLVNADFELEKECPLREVLSLTGDKWSIHVLHELHAGPRRFTELERAIKGVSRRMLTVTLRNLERNGLITRTVYAEVPPRVVYAHTSLTEDLATPLAALVEWARQRRPDVLAARRAYDSRAAAAATTSPV